MNNHLPAAILARMAEHGETGLSRQQRDHLATCTACRDAVFETGATAREFRTRGGLEAPASLVSTILTRTADGAGKRPGRHRR